MSNANNILLFFIFQGHDIRVVIHDGEPWFVAKDVCEVLEISNVSQAINGNTVRNETGLDEDEKHIYQVYTSGGPRATLCINEPGLYRLIAKSHKPEAKTFQRWVYHEVLPAIRKTGRYSLPQQEEMQTQPSQWLNWDNVLITTLSKDEHMRLIRYERARLSFLESAYDFKYSPQTHNSEYPQEEQKRQPIEPIVIPPVDAKPDVQTILLDYLHKTGTSITVRQLQQSGPRLLRNLPADHLRAILQALVTSGVLAANQVGKSEHYRLL